MLKVVELFGGIGAFTKALKKLDKDFKVIDYVEIDKNAVKSYNTLYNTNFIPQNICDFSLKDGKIDILMHGSPCQDFSNIGLKKGGEKGSNTRSSLLFETIRIIEEAKYKPTWIIWENVKGVLNKKMRNSFFSYLDELKKLGYETKYSTLNALDFGIPQNRTRLFAISYLGTNNFDFSKLKKVAMRSIDEVLEKEVDEKYIVRQASILKHIDLMLKTNEEVDTPLRFKGRCQTIKDYAYTITTKQMRIPNSGLVDLGNGHYRYLTEKECFRLMGFSDEDFNKLIEIHSIKNGKTSSILYKQAGNSIVVDVLEAIIKEIIK